MFFDEFSRLLESVIVDPKCFMICGYFNFHVEDSTNIVACNNIDVLESANIEKATLLI